MWWTEQVERAVVEKRRAYKKWRESRDEDDRRGYERARRAARIEVSRAKAAGIERLAAVRGPECFRVARRMATERRDVVAVESVRDRAGSLRSGPAGLEVWRVYYDGLLNCVRECDGVEAVCPVEGPVRPIDREEVCGALAVMPAGRAAGGSGLSVEMLRAGGAMVAGKLAELFGRVWAEGTLPVEWRSSVIVPVYKKKGDPLDCGSYRAVKLLEHAMKVMERVIERRLRMCVSVHEMQRGFVSGRSTADAIFVLRQLLARHLEVGEALWTVFVDLEKAYDTVPRELVWWALRKQGVEESLVGAVRALYDGPVSVVRVAGQLSRPFAVSVGLHQGSVLSPLLFVLVMECVSARVRVGLPWEVLYADDLVLVGRSEESVAERYGVWKRCLEGAGLRVNEAKTKVMCVRRGGGLPARFGRWPCAVCGRPVGASSIRCTVCGKWVHRKCAGVAGSLQRAEAAFVCSVCAAPRVDPVRDRLMPALEEVDSFSYLGDVVHAGGSPLAAVVSRIRSAWAKWKELAPFLAARGFRLTSKALLFTSCVRPVATYAAGLWPVRDDGLRLLSRMESRMLRWMAGLKRADSRLSYSELLELFRIAPIADVVRSARVAWLGHVLRKEPGDGVRAMLDYATQGSRSRGRPRTRWIDVAKEDMRARGLTEGDALDGNKWKAAIKHAVRPSKRGKRT